MGGEADETDESLAVRRAQRAVDGILLEQASRRRQINSFHADLLEEVVEWLERRQKATTALHVALLPVALVKGERAKARCGGAAAAGQRLQRIVAEMMLKALHGTWCETMIHDVESPSWYVV